MLFLLNFLQKIFQKFLCILGFWATWGCPAQKNLDPGQVGVSRGFPEILGVVPQPAAQQRHHGPDQNRAGLRTRPGGFWNLPTLTVKGWGGPPLLWGPPLSPDTSKARGANLKFLLQPRSCPRSLFKSSLLESPTPPVRWDVGSRPGAPGEDRTRVLREGRVPRRASTPTDPGGGGGGGGGSRKRSTRPVGTKARWVARKAGTKPGSCSRSPDTSSRSSRSRGAARSARTLLVR